MENGKSFCLPPTAFRLPPSAVCLLPSAFAHLPAAHCSAKRMPARRKTRHTGDRNRGSAQRIRPPVFNFLSNFSSHNAVDLRHADSQEREIRFCTLAGRTVRRIGRSQDLHLSPSLG